MFHGGAPHLQFWQALDTALNRQVALTFVDPDGALPNDQLREILSRTMRLSRIDKPGIARVLDVVHTGTGGLVVAEWVRGGSLQEVADTSPSAVGAARAMQALAAAAEAAHHAGVALSIDHPSRVRVSIEGDVVLAFPATIRTPAPKTTFAGSALRCMRCWSIGGRCRNPGSPAGWRRHRGIRPANPSNPVRSTAKSPSRFLRPRLTRSRVMVESAVQQHF